MFFLGCVGRLLVFLSGVCDGEGGDDDEHEKEKVGG